MAGSERHQQDSSGHQPEYRSAAPGAWSDLMSVTEREATAATSRTGLPTESVYCAGAGADVSVCHSPNTFSCGSLQAENQPMAGTGAGSPAFPPSSVTRAAPP